MLLALYVAVACALAVVTYASDEARFAPHYALLVIELPLSPLVAIALWVTAYAVNVVTPDLAVPVVPIVSIAFWTLGALANALLVGWVVRAFRGAPEPKTDPPTEAAGP